jgi:predicted PurR-regulated permease PerM
MMVQMARDGPSTRTLVRIFLTFTGLAAVLYLLYVIRGVLLLVAASVFLAVALGPAVDRVARSHVPRIAAILSVYVALTLATFGLGLVFVPTLVSGVQSLATSAPSYIQTLRKDRTFRKYDNRYHVTKKLNQQAAALPGRLSTAASTLSNITVGVFSALAQLITVLTIAFFLLLDGGRWLRQLLELLPQERAEPARKIATEIYRTVAGYVAGNLAISVIAGVVSFVTLVTLGVPFALPLAVLMAFFDLIPLVGATIGAVLVGVVTLFNGFPTSTIVWAIVQIVYQQVESYVIVPVVYRHTVEVNGLVTIVAVLIGGTLLGILGALVAIPVAGALQLVIRELWAARRRGVEARVIDPGSAPPLV